MLRQILSNVKPIVTNKVRKTALCTKSMFDLNIDKEGIAVLNMQRSPVNSMNLEFLQELDKFLDYIAVKERCKGLVVTSAFPTVFSAGLDLRELHEPDVKRLDSFFGTLIDVSMKLYSSPFASAVAINGHTAAGACVLTMTFEYRVMVNKSVVIGFNDTSVGIVPSEWIIAIMTDVIGKRQMEKAIIGSSMFSPEEALRVGLVDELGTDNADAVEKCKKYIRRFDNISPSVRAATKQMIRKPLLDQVQENKHRYVKYLTQSVINSESQKYINDYVQSIKLKKAGNLK